MNDLYKENVGDIYSKKRIKDYLHFLIKVSQISKCHINGIKESQKKIDFYPISSNQQFIHFLKLTKKMKKEYYLCNLQILLNHYLPVEDVIKLIQMIQTNKDITDDKIYHHIFESKHKYDIKTIKKIYDPNLFCTSNDYIVSKVIRSFLYQYKRKFGIPFFEHEANMNNMNIMNRIYENKIQHKEKIKHDFQYLNIGCDEDIHLLKKEFHLENEDVYGADFKLHKNFHYQFQMIHKDGKIHYPDQFFNFISCGFVLEDIPNLPLFIQELYRILKPNGFILIYQQDKTNILDQYLFSFQRILDYYTHHPFSKNDYHSFMKTVQTKHYMNYINWHILFKMFHMNRFVYGSCKKSLYYQPTFKNTSYYIYIKD